VNIATTPATTGWSCRPQVKVQVNDGVNLNVAVKVKVLVKVNVEVFVIGSVFLVRLAGSIPLHCQR
jgi:hypothetical protein